MVAEVTGIDFSENSLESAKELARKEGVQVNFIHGSLRDYEFPQQYYDMVISHMVLQHVIDRHLAFSNIISSLKPNGVVVIRIMQLFGSIYPNRRYNTWQYWLVKFLAGDDLAKRVRLADRLFFRNKDIEGNHGIKRENYLWDCFAAKISYHTYGELLRWFKSNNIRYLSSNPPMEFGKLVGQSVERETSGVSAVRKIIYGFLKPVLKAIPFYRWPVFNKCNFLNRALSQLAIFFIPDVIMIMLAGEKTRG